MIRRVAAPQVSMAADSSHRAVACAEEAVAAAARLRAVAEEELHDLGGGEDDKAAGSSR